MSFKHVLLTGPPGVGKTTVVEKVCGILKESHANVQGFFTKDVRDGGQRIGFDVISTSGEHGSLARLNDMVRKPGPKVGRYVVDTTSFEEIALPSLNCTPPCILVIDEIGKMELFSQNFKEAVRKAFSTPNVRILATVPVTNQHSIDFVEKIKSRSDVTLVKVTKANRNVMPEQVIQLLNSS